MYATISRPRRERAISPPVEVRDAGNHGRLLGHLTRRPLDKADGRRIIMALPSELSLYDFDPAKLQAEMASPNAHSITFDVCERATAGGWERIVYLATSATLEDLQRIETFRLPGETDAQADHRRMRA